MLSTINIDHILFLDIETVPRWESFDQMPENFQKLWEHKTSYFSNKATMTPEQMYDRAGIYAEFGKIICISVGHTNAGSLKIKSFYGNDEKTLLLEFAGLLNKHFCRDNQSLCAHNGKEFDYPYIARRMVVNGIQLPFMLDTTGKKPWQVHLLDTMEMWKFGDYKSYTSLALLSALFDIPSSKDDIDGSDVARVFWRENNLKRIVTYCQKDVIAIAQLFLRYQGKDLIPEDKIVEVEQ